MATVTIKHYGKSLIAAFNKEIDLLDDAIQFIFSDSTHSPDQDTHDYLDDILSGDRISGTNWAATGVALANDTLTYTAGTNVLKYDADDISVSTVTFSDAKNCHIYDSTPASDATRPLIGFGILDTTLNPNAGTVTVTFDSAGILTFTAAA